MISNFISMNVVLQEVIRDLDIGDEDIPISDFKEWIIEGLKHIGVITQYDKRPAKIDIEDYVGELPCDFFKLHKLLDGVLYRHNPDIEFTNDATLAEKQKEIVPLRRTTDADINIVQKNIKTSFKSGTVSLLYWAFPLDKDGFLYVPDDISYKDALFWKVAYQLSIRGYKFKNAQLNDIRFTGTHWRFYVKQARGAGRMPDLELLERLKNNFTTLVIDTNQYKNNFRHLGERENLTLDTNTQRFY